MTSTVVRSFLRERLSAASRSAIEATFSAIAPMLWGLLIGGERLSPVALAGLAVALVAVVLVGFIPGEKVVRPSPRGLAMAVGAGAAIGGFLIVVDQTSSGSGLVPLVTSRATSAALTLAIVAAMAVIAVRKGLPAASVLTPRAPVIGATPSGHADLEHVLETRTLSDIAALLELEPAAGGGAV